MRVFISVDIEGITGVCHVAQADDLGSEAWREACGLMRGDLDAALAGCAAAGVGGIVITDGHYDGDNVRADGLPEGVILVSGAQTDLSMMQGIGAEFDAALFVGYHAMAGTEAGTLAHTWDGELAAVMLLEPDNGRRAVGELGLNAGVAGAFGVPVVFASGDDKLAAEARSLLPGIETAVVKEGVSRTGALLYDPATARAAIRGGVERALRAVGRRGSPAPLCWDGYGLELTFGRSEWCDKATRYPDAVRIDGLRLELRGGDWLAIYRGFVACTALAES